jgi:hypothetical protein
LREKTSMTSRILKLAVRIFWNIKSA